MVQSPISTACKGERPPPDSLELPTTSCQSTTNFSENKHFPQKQKQVNRNMSESQAPPQSRWGKSDKLHTLLLILTSAHRECVLPSLGPEQAALRLQNSPHPTRYTDTPLSLWQKLPISSFHKLELFQGLYIYFISFPDSPLSIYAWALTQFLSLYSDDCRHEHPQS